jgi:hypothetical protein
MTEKLSDRDIISFVDYFYSGIKTVLETLEKEKVL